MITIMFANGISLNGTSFLGKKSIDGCTDLVNKHQSGEELMWLKLIGALQ